MPFQPGNPGGPGRPRGSRNVLNQRLDEIAAGGAEAVLKKLMEIAAEGDRSAARMVLSRIWSAPKSRTVEIDLPVIDNPDDAVRANGAVMRAMADGALTTEEGAAFSAVIEIQRRAIETLILDKRAKELEVQLREEKEKLGR